LKLAKPYCSECSSSSCTQFFESRVVFGAGSLYNVRAEVERLGLDRVLVLSTPEQKDMASAVSDSLGNASVGVHAEARMHVPRWVADDGVAPVRSLGAQATSAVGGGSTVGLGKAIALETGLPLIAVPTTNAGSDLR